MVLRSLLVLWVGVGILVGVVYSWQWLPVFLLILGGAWVLGRGLGVSGSAFESWSSRLYGEDDRRNGPPRGRR